MEYFARSKVTYFQKRSIALCGNCFLLRFSRVARKYIQRGNRRLICHSRCGQHTDNIAIGSIEYALSHLNAPLVVVLGHTCCGAVNAAICGGAEGHIKSITDKIKLAIGDENNDYAACKLNVNSEVRAISKSLSQENISAKVMGASITSTQV